MKTADKKTQTADIDYPGDILKALRVGHRIMMANDALSGRDINSFMAIYCSRKRKGAGNEKN